MASQPPTPDPVSRGEPLIEADALRKVYPGPKGGVVEAVRGATFSVHAGEIFGLLGPNGAGKTTLLRMLATIIAPTSGSCRVAGVAVAEQGRTARRHIGFLSGNTRLYARLTGREILHYFGNLYDISARDVTARTEELADVLGMHEFLDQRCETLSTGQTQKLSIARVLLHDPPVLILDEPTLGLDIMTSRSILEFIQSARNRGRAIIFSTHYMTEADQLCTRVGLIYKGALMGVGPKDELLRSTGTDNLQDAFLAQVGAAEPA